jgi:propanol-preferring alcohol dehydrogenase
MSKMQAMVFEAQGRVLQSQSIPVPEPRDDQVLVRVKACAVCRTDLHVLDGELPNPKLPLVPGHEIVGVVEKTGRRVESIQVGDRVGIPWLGWTCGECRFCRSGRENLCDEARYTGYTLDGGYAEYTTADARYCFPIDDSYGHVEAAPLLCAGLIGYRSLRMAGDAQRMGIYGFGAAAHLMTQVAMHEGRKVYAFTRPNDTEGQRFAREIGAAWAGSSDQPPPEKLDAAIILAPVGNLVVYALHALDKGGVLVCGGIHMSEIPSFPYELLWHERSIKSVANLTRRDGKEFLQLAPRIPVRTRTQIFPLREANQALTALRDGKLNGAAVLVPSLNE